MKTLLPLVAGLLLCGCESTQNGEPKPYKPPDSYIGTTRPPTTAVTLVRPGEDEPGPEAELLGRYIRTGNLLQADAAAKLAKRVGANFIIYGTKMRTGGAYQDVPDDPEYDNDVIFYRDPSKPGL